MRWLFNICYLTLLVLCSPWLILRAWRQQKYRQGWAAKILGRAPTLPKGKTRVWLHAVSMGEVHLLEPLVKQIALSHPEWECVISTTTKSGWEAAARKFEHLTRFYCPLDFSWAVDQAMRRIGPDLLVLSELELWPNLIESAKRHGTKVAIVNGRLSERSYRGYSRLRWFATRLLSQIDCVAVQNETYAERFRQLGGLAESIHVTGSIKFDGAVTNRDNSETAALRRLARIPDDAIVFLAGSTQDPEETLAFEAFKQLAPDHARLRLLLAPRHPERFDAVAGMLAARNVVYQRRSEFSEVEADPDCRVTLIDSLGELRAWWGTSDIAYVGGSMGARGGQNMIEPSAYGAAVAFGPNTRNFRDIVALLLERNAARVVADGDELTAFLRKCLTDDSFASSLGNNAQRAVLAQIGAAEGTVELLSGLLSDTAKFSAAA